MKKEKEKQFKEILAQIKACDENLTEVNLSDFELRGTDIELLCQVLPGSKITSLNLGLLGLWGEGLVVTLTQVLAQTQITTLGLNDGSMSANAAKVLVQGLAQTQITSLDLKRNGIRMGFEGEGAAALAQGLAQTQITTLGFTDNCIDGKGAEILAQVLPKTKITSLDLRENEIGPKGAKSLAQVLADTQITSLDLGDNKIGPEGVMALAQVL